MWFRWSKIEFINRVLLWVGLTRVGDIVVQHIFIKINVISSDIHLAPLLSNRLILTDFLRSRRLDNISSDDDHTAQRQGPHRLVLMRRLIVEEDVGRGLRRRRSSEGLRSSEEFLVGVLVTQLVPADDGFKLSLSKAGVRLGCVRDDVRSVRTLARRWPNRNLRRRSKQVVFCVRTLARRLVSCKQRVWLAEESVLGVLVTSRAGRVLLRDMALAEEVLLRVLPRWSRTRRSQLLSYGCPDVGWKFGGLPVRALSGIGPVRRRGLGASRLRIASHTIGCRWLLLSVLASAL